LLLFATVLLFSLSLFACSLILLPSLFTTPSPSLRTGDVTRSDKERAHGQR